MVTEFNVPFEVAFWGLPFTRRVSCTTRGTVITYAVTTLQLGVSGRFGADGFQTVGSVDALTG